MNNKYTINLNCVVLSVDNQKNQTYILSTDSKEIIFPKLTVDNNYVDDIDDALIQFLKTKTPESNELQLIGQIIRLHHPMIEPKENDVINTIYGFIVEYDTNIVDSYWIPFSYIDIVKYSSVIFETIQKLK